MDLERRAPRGSSACDASRAIGVSRLWCSARAEVSSVPKGLAQNRRVNAQVDGETSSTSGSEDVATATRDDRPHRDMAARGRLWGAKRIRGELLKVGINQTGELLQGAAAGCLFFVVSRASVKRRRRSPSYSRRTRFSSWRYSTISNWRRFTNPRTRAARIGAARPTSPGILPRGEDPGAVGSMRERRGGKSTMLPDGFTRSWAGTGRARFSPPSAP